MNLDRIASLAAAGLKAAQISTIVGLSPGRISQLSSTEEYQLILAEKTSALTEKNVEEEAISAKYAVAEHALIDQMMQMAPVSELRDVTAALRVVSERQEKMKSRLVPASSSQNQLTVVSISLPSYALPTLSVTMNSQKEVLSVDALELAPMNSKSVQALFKGGENDSRPSTTSSEASPALLEKEITEEEITELGFLEYARA
ncbi:MAG: hypothetical protein ACD_86C00001G0007 [uncultured bacterium]|nr:MAG: hypothetical protein ACD_86C00001G0007 [uncultured bacterium]